MNGRYKVEQMKLKTESIPGAFKPSIHGPLLVYGYKKN